MRTAGEVITRCRAHCNDPDNGRPVFSRSMLFEKLNACMLGSVAIRLSLGELLLVNAVSVTTGDYIFTLPTGVTYKRVTQVRSQARGMEMAILSSEAMAAMWSGVIDRSRNKGYADRCSLREEPDGTVRITLFPWPSRADTLDIMESLLPSAVSTEADNVYLDDTGCEALAYDMACELIGMANMEKITALRIDKGVVGLYSQKRDIALRESRKRIAALRAAGKVRHSRR